MTDSQSQWWASRNVVGLAGAGLRYRRDTTPFVHYVVGDDEPIQLTCNGVRIITRSAPIMMPATRSPWLRPWFASPAPLSRQYFGQVLP